MIAKRIYSGFSEAHDTYGALSIASDGKIYYILSSEDPKIGGHFYVYDPKKSKSDLIGDLTELCGEKEVKVIGQGKSHVPFYEMEGKLYFSTHIGIYELIDGMDRLPKNPIKGYGRYPGGHFLSYDLNTKQVMDLGKAPYGEGIISMTMDIHRGNIFAITWPTGYFLHFDLKSNLIKNIGKISYNGEGGFPRSDFRVLCRSLVVDPNSGIVYFSNAEGDILYYNPVSELVQKKEKSNLKKDYFGQYDPTMPGSMAYNWRKVFWYEKENVIMGIHGNSGYLFKFSPENDEIELMQRLTSVPSLKSGMFDQFSYGYLGFDIDEVNDKIYYLTGGPIYVDGARLTGVEKIAKGAARGIENLHLVTYHIPSGEYIDHGTIFYEDGSRPTYVNSIAISEDRIYFLGRININGKKIQDLAWVEKPN